MSLDLELVRLLKSSRRIIGEASPIVVDYDGEILSGRHRKEAGWLRVHRVDSRKLAEKWNFTPEIAKDMVRLHLNIQRKPSKKETEIIIKRIAVNLEKMGVPKEQISNEIAKYVPYSRKYILQILPDEYKQSEKVIAGKKSFSVRMSRTEESPVSENKPVSARIETRVIKPKDTWQHIKDVMQPPVSRMDEAVILELQKHGIPFEAQKEFCVQSTICDVYLPDKQIAIYLDGPVHEGREDRDETLREMLAGRYGIKVVSIPYERFSKSTLKEIVERIMEVRANG